MPRPFSTIRELFVAVRETLGLRSTLLLVLLALVLAPLVVVFLIVMTPLVWLVDGIGWLLKKYRGVGTRIEDPVFGPLTYDSSWYTERDHELLGGLYSICITAPLAPEPGPEQHKMLHEFIARQNDIRKEAEDALYAEYQRLSPQWREYWRDIGNAELSAEMLKTLPILDNPAQIWSVLGDGSITFEEEPGSFFISWHGPGDGEHGMSASFSDWKLLEVAWD